MLGIEIAEKDEAIEFTGLRSVSGGVMAVEFLGYEQDCFSEGWGEFFLERVVKGVKGVGRMM